ncbi:MAG: hypothetical protein F6J93_04285 [Oscillatoria sp. SIO1A7]|nr:hypothetical protein [Oscillatoria sp. SIO1A7]
MPRSNLIIYNRTDSIQGSWQAELSATTIKLIMLSPQGRFALPYLIRVPGSVRLDAPSQPWQQPLLRVAAHWHFGIERLQANLQKMPL